LARDIVIQEKVYSGIVVTNSETVTQNVLFRQDDKWKHGKTDGIFSFIVYPVETSGTLGTLAISIKPLDEHGVTFANTDYNQVIKSAGTVLSKVKGTDGGYGYEVTGLPKCWGVEISFTHVGTAVMTIDLSVLF
jgi:hypothetical protein